jgi:hypothetical protein
MAQVVSRRLLTAEAWVSPCGICGEQSNIRTRFLRDPHFSLSVSFHRCFPCSYIIWIGLMDNRIVGCRSSETQFHPFDMKMKHFGKKQFDYINETCEA